MYGVGFCKTRLGEERAVRAERNRKMLDDLTFFQDAFPEDIPPGSACPRPPVFALTRRGECRDHPYVVLIRIAVCKQPALPIFIRFNVPDVNPGSEIAMHSAAEILASIAWTSSLTIELADQAEHFDVDFIRCRWINLHTLVILGRGAVADGRPKKPRRDPVDPIMRLN